MCLALLLPQVFSTKQFIDKPAEERASIMRTFTDKQIEDVETAIAVMPHFDIEYQAFVKVRRRCTQIQSCSAHPLVLRCCRAMTTTLQLYCSTFASPKRRR